MSAAAEIEALDAEIKLCLERRTEAVTLGEAERAATYRLVLVGLLQERNELLLES
jgi:hypothetical protein